MNISDCITINNCCRSDIHILILTYRVSLITALIRIAFSATVLTENFNNLDLVALISSEL
jgi:hypothetical protein